MEANTFAKRLRLWAIFDAPWVAIFRLLALPDYWLRRVQLNVIVAGDEC